jgi:hypothetical protein
MARLMQRVRGDSPSPLIDAPDIDALPLVPAASEPCSDFKAESEPVARHEDFDERCPRRPVPELATNISAMRELANTAARSAIDRHVRQHTGKQAAGKLLGAGLTIVASGLLGYWAVRAASLPAGVAAVIGGCAGCYWTWAAYRRLTAFRRLNQISALESQTPQNAPPLPAAANRVRK